MAGYRYQQAMIERVEEALDISIHRPVVRKTELRGGKETFVPRRLQLLL